MSSNGQSNAASMPSREEIVALINQKKGIAHVWQTLRGKYGDPKGTYGAVVYAAILSRNKANHVGHDNMIDNPSHSDVLDNARNNTETVCKPEDQPISLTAKDYFEIQIELMDLRNALSVVASLLMGVISRQR